MALANRRDNILLVNIDSTIPNLALCKIEKYYKDLGYGVEYGDCPLFATQYSKIFVSCIFPENKARAKEWEQFPNCELGGSGWDLKKTLPADIDDIKPKINWGFTTRGCIRKCPFCFVPEKEGGVRVVGDIYDIWDGKSKKITLMDNNILALPQHFLKIATQLIEENIRVDFNQGLDHRLLTPDICKILLELKHSAEIRFAFDDICYHPSVEKALLMLRNAGLKDWQTRWYVYIGEKDTFQTVYNRMEFLRKNKQLVYVMRDRKVAKEKKYIALARWGNAMGAFKLGCIFDLCNKSELLKPYKKIIESEKLF